MDHPATHSGHPVKTSSDRAFGWVFAVFFAIVGCWPLLHAERVRLWALLLAAGFVLVATFRPTWLAPLNRQWTRLGFLLHKIGNPVVMGVIYVLSIVPIGLLLRLLGKDHLHLKRQPDAASYWVVRQPPGPHANSLPRQF